MFEYDSSVFQEAKDVPGMGAIFRGILDVSVNLGIMDDRQKRRIWVEWQTWDGKLEDFINKEVSKILKPRQFSLFLGKLKN